ncbi:MAG TPA: hypothetical protein VGZ23_10800 [bacterium]|nr:hypothetical protein [bacterium]
MRAPAHSPATWYRWAGAAVSAAVAVAMTGPAVGPSSSAAVAPAVIRAPVLVARGATSDATASNNEVKLLRTRDGLVAAYAGDAGGTQVLLAASRDGGGHWVPLGQASDGPVASRLAALAADAAGRVHVVWTRYDDGVGKVYYREWAPSARGGPAGGWLAPQRRISPEGLYAGYPAVALDRAGRPRVVWYGIRAGPTPAPTRHGSIYEILSTEYDGRTWSPPVLVSTGVPDSINPALASDFTGRLHAVWYQYDGRVYQVRYAAYGAGWGAPEGVSRTPSDEFNPDVAVDARGGLALVWEQHEAQASVIDYARRAGGAWSEPVAVSAAGGRVSVFHPSVASDASGATWTAWDSDDGQIYARRYKGGWGPILRLTADGGNTFPGVLSDAGALDVIWTHTGPAGSSVYFARVTARP